MTYIVGAIVIVTLVGFGAYYLITNLTWKKKSDKKDLTN
jgi:hypothetical protein